MFGSASCALTWESGEAIAKSARHAAARAARTPRRLLIARYYNRSSGLVVAPVVGRGAAVPGGLSAGRAVCPGLPTGGRGATGGLATLSIGLAVVAAGAGAVSVPGGGAAVCVSAGGGGDGASGCEVAGASGSACVPMVRKASTAPNASAAVAPMARSTATAAPRRGGMITLLEIGRAHV